MHKLLYHTDCTVQLSAVSLEAAMQSISWMVKKRTEAEAKENERETEDEPY